MMMMVVTTTMTMKMNITMEGTITMMIQTNIISIKAPH